MSETKAMRIVQNGKVYRQMFDAQLQLSKSLTQVAKCKTLPALVKISHIPANSLSELSSTAPVVHLEPEDTKHGLLTPRQQTWVEGFPNDPYTENPVLYKQFKQFISSQYGDTESRKAGKEVRGLPDVVVPAKTGSDIIDRITVGRKQRYETAVEDMYQELAVISEDMEKKIVQVSKVVLQKLAKGDLTLTSILARIEKDENLLTYSLEDLSALWKEIEHFSPLHQKWITELDIKFRTLEEERMGQIRFLFQEYYKILEKISFLLTSDLDRFMDKESQAVNQILLSNRRAYADLFVRLMTADIEREKSQHRQWCRRVEDWKNLKKDKALEAFREFMESEEVLKPPGVMEAQNVMVSELDHINSQRLDLVKSLRELKPPTSTKSAVYKWKQQIQKVTKELDRVNQMHMSKLHEEMEKVCHSCLEKVESIKLSLIEEGVVTENQAKQMIEEQMLPLVGVQQRLFEDNLEIMEKAQEEHSKKVESDLHSLFKFSQGVAHLWDVHEIGLARQERALQEKLEECRQNHDYSNQEREANLDIVMDQMRQDATESGLQSSLAKALEMLENICNFYIEFHQTQTAIVHTYPDMVQGELDRFDSAVCTFFSVDRIHPEDKAEAVVDMERTEKSELSHTTTGSRSPRQSSRTSVKLCSPEHVEQESAGPFLAAVAEILSTEKGTTFYVLKVAGDHGVHTTADKEGVKTAASEMFSDVSGGFVMEIPSTTEEEKADYISCINIPTAHIVEVKKMMRLNFLNHLETWCQQAKERSTSIVVAKCEELNSELDLRLHLHQPRSRRAELDVHNVRAAELVMHAERVICHCRGIVSSLTELRSRFSEMSSQHNKLAHKFRQDIEALEVVFINATKSSRLVALQNKLGVELEKFMSVIRTSLRQFRQHLDENLQMLRESNARFIKSFKLFSDGGNFCPEEITDYCKRLEKMSNTIDIAEGSIMSELEGMESKRLSVATKVANEFEDRFKHHMFDLLFMEKVARWLTNTQVKIKAEVAASNCQAQTLICHLRNLEHHIDAYEKPNIDKKQITSTELNELLTTIMEAFKQRCEFLNCLKTDDSKLLSSQKHESQLIPVSKVGLVPEGVTPVSKAGKQPTEDPTVPVIRRILRTQKAKVDSGTDVDVDGDSEFVAGGSSATAPSSPLVTAAEGAHEKIKTKNSREMRVGAIEKPTISHLSSGQRRTSKVSRVDRKFILVCDDDDHLSKDGLKEESHFVTTVQHILLEAQQGLLTTAEIYYRQKGSRAVTRPQVLQETHDQCQDALLQKLQTYHQQCDDYHNQCLQEYRRQLIKLEELAAKVPGFLIFDLIKHHKQKAQDASRQLQIEFQLQLDQINQRQKHNENSLRPCLGHPNQVLKLEDLCQQENQRHNDYLSAVEKHTRSLQLCAETHAKKMLDELRHLSERLLHQFDELLVVDDIEKGRVEPTRISTTQLIRRQNAGETVEDEVEKEVLPRGKGNWRGLPRNQLIAENRPAKLLFTPLVKTAKTTLGHISTVRARDTSYEEYRIYFEKVLAMIDKDKEQMLQYEQHWNASWLLAVQHIRDLYPRP